MKNSTAILFLLFLLLVLALTFAIPKELHEQMIELPKIDFYGHFFSFFILTWFINYVVKLPLISVVVALILYAALSELGQLYLGFRNGEMRDFVADVGGILTFAVIKWANIVYGKRQPLY